jgi:hypothetical protein
VLTCAGAFDPSSLSLTAKDDPNCANEKLDFTNSGPVTLMCDDEVTVNYNVTDSCDNQDECEVTVTVKSPDPVCKIEKDGKPIENVPFATCASIESLPLPTITDVCGYNGITTSDANILNTLTCKASAPVKSVFYNFSYTRDIDGLCPAGTSCGYNVSITCNNDTAFGYVQPVTDKIIPYGNRQLKLDSNWGWGSYYHELSTDMTGEYEYKMYARASDEDPKPVNGKYVGSVMVNPVGGNYTMQGCKSASLTDIHVEISQPSKSYGIDDKGKKISGAYPVPGSSTLFCRPLRPPGKLSIQQPSCCCCCRCCCRCC